MIRLDRFLTLSLFSPLHALTLKRRLRIPILMYHSISGEVEQGIHSYYRTVTTPVVFARHMALLKELGYQVVGLDTAMQLLGNDTDADRDRAQKPVVITFDDGFLDFYTEAFPVLSQHGFTATVFLPTSFIDAGGKTIMGRPFLTWDQVRELVDAGITFGSHTASHEYLARLDRNRIEEELRKSKAVIEDKTGNAVHFFSFPYAFPEHKKGLVSFLCETLIKCGYRGAVTTRIGTAAQGDDLFSLKRIPVNNDDDPKLLLAKLAGGYNWLHALQYAAKSGKGMLGYRRRTMGEWINQ